MTKSSSYPDPCKFSGRLGQVQSLPWPWQSLHSRRRKMSPQSHSSLPSPIWYGSKLFWLPIFHSSTNLFPGKQKKTAVCVKKYQNKTLNGEKFQVAEMTHALFGNHENPYWRPRGVKRSNFQLAFFVGKKPIQVDNYPPFFFSRGCFPNKHIPPKKWCSEKFNTETAMLPLRLYSNTKK